MSKISFIFPGQGSQAIGMGAALAERYPEARQAFDEASSVLGWDLLKACREGPDDRLRQTDVAQPALYVTGYAAFRVLRSLGVSPEGAAGHSIGEYAALAAANVFSFKEGVGLVRERGRLMQEAAQARPGTMAAILGLAPDQVAEVCRGAQSVGICVPVNFNTPEQVVIAGEKAAVEKASTIASEKGAKRVIPLNVAGAFHSPLMHEAAKAMTQLLEKTTFQDASFPVFMNVDGRARTSAGEIRQALARQLDSSVQWLETIQALKAAGYTIYVECGAGRVLSGLLRRIDRQLQAFATETPEAIEEIGNSIGAVRKGQS